MAAVAPHPDQTSDLLQTLSLDSQVKGLEIPEPIKKPSVDSSDSGNGQIQMFDRSLTPLLPDFVDPNMCYVPNGYANAAYYYGGYDGTSSEWGEYSRYVNPDGAEMSHGVYGDNGSLLYHGYGYTPYGPYSPAGSPVTAVGHDGQLYGAQHYQYPSPYFQSIRTPNGAYTTPAAVAPKNEISTTVAADHVPLSSDSASVNSNGIVNGGALKGSIGSVPGRPTTYQNSLLNANGSFGRGVQNAYQDPRFTFDGVRSPVPWLDGPIVPDGQLRPINSTPITSSASIGNGVTSRNQNLRPPSHLMGMQSSRPMSGMSTSGYMSRIYSNKFYGQYGSTFRTGFGFGSNAYDSRNSGRGWLAIDSKYKPRGRGNGFFAYGNETIDGLNELNRGPRARSSSKNQKIFAPVALAVKGQNMPLTEMLETEKEKLEKLSSIPDREQYNRLEFPENYPDAKFFIIKSYSEDDVHKSIKYNVWASTQNGNKKLDAAYQEAQHNPGGCPVFLFFSVNTSGQFVGVAEMIGPVDFNKNVDYWQQDKWIGCFPVKWHIVKDLPNSLLKHITLENNENKPVTNSRDTQEVKLEQGLQILKIFKEHSSKQCILDDFDFYEDRQKRIQEKKAKQLFQKQVWEGKPSDEISKEGFKGEVILQKRTEAGIDLVQEATQAVQVTGDAKISDNGSVLKSGDVPKGNKIVGNTPRVPKHITSEVIGKGGGNSF